MANRVHIDQKIFIRQAIKLFNVGGLANIKIHTLAKKCNCSTMPMYRNFGSMDNLRNMVLDKIFDDLEEYLSNKSNTSLRHTIDQILKKYPGFVFEIRGNTTVVTRLTRVIKTFYPEKQLYEIRAAILLTDIATRIKPFYDGDYSSVIDGLISRTSPELQKAS